MMKLLPIFGLLIFDFGCFHMAGILLPQNVEVQIKPLEQALGRGA